MNRKIRLRIPSDVLGEGIDLTNYTRKDVDEIISGNWRFVNPLDANITGNAQTASKLSQPIQINITGFVSGSAEFDGSQNVSISVVGPDLSIYARKNFDEVISGTWTFESPIIGDITGTATFSEKWKIPRTITISGAVSGSATIDGSSDIFINTASNIDLSGYAKKDFDETISGNWTFTNPINADITGKSAESEKLSTPRRISLVGSVYGTAIFDGSQDITIITTGDGGSGSLDLSEYAKKDQDETITGQWTFSSPINITELRGSDASISISSGDVIFKLDPTFSGGKTLKVVSGSGINETDLFVLKTSGNVGIGNTSPEEKLDVSGNVKANTFIGNLQGNALTATKLQTPRQINITGFVSGSGYFDGSQDITISVLGPDMSYFTKKNQDETISGNWTFENPIQGDLLGTASFSEKWKTARTITLTGAVSGSSSIDGSSDIVISTTSNLDLSDYTRKSQNETITGNWAFTNQINANITGNAETATKLRNPITISLVGPVTGSALLDGSQNVSITTQVTSDIPRKSLSETISGTWTFSSGIFAQSVSGEGISIDGQREDVTIKFDSDSLGDKKFKIIVGSFTSETEIFTLTSTGRLGLGKTNPTEKLEIDGNVKANTFIGNLQGNASTSSKWFSPITISLTGDVLGSASIDGSSSVSISTTLNTSILSNYAKKNENETISGNWTFLNPISGNVLGNASSASKWQTPRVITLSGDVTGSVSLDGSQDVVILTYASSELTRKSNNENVSGFWSFSSGIETSSISGNGITLDARVGEITLKFDRNNAQNKKFRILKGENETESEIFTLLSNGKVGIGVSSPTEKLEVDGNIKANIFIGNLQGNASTANKWSNARTLTLVGDVSGSVSIDGSSDINLITTVNSSLFSDYTKKNVDETISGTWSFTNPIIGDITGNANTANKWKTARTITLSGDVSGSVLLDGSQDVTLSTSVSSNFTKRNVAENITGEWVFSSGIKTSKVVGEPSLLIKSNSDSANSIVVKNSSETASVLAIDTENIRIGINKTSPQYTLDVNGTIQTVGFKLPTGAVAGYVLTSDNYGNASWQPAPSGGGSVDLSDYPKKNQNETITGQWTFTQTILGTAEMSNKWSTARTITLSGDVSGSTSIDGSQNVTINTIVSSDIPRKSNNEVISGYWNFSSGILTQNISGGTEGISIRIDSENSGNKKFSVIKGTGTNEEEILTIKSDGNIGIGKPSPTEKLDVSGNLRANKFISTTTTSSPLQVSSSTLVDNLNADLLDGYHATNFARKDANETITGTWSFSNPISANITGTASQANKWTTARTISLSGDVLGSTTLDGSQDVTISTSVSSNIPRKNNNETISGTWTFSSGINTNYISGTGISINSGTGGVSIKIDTDNSSLDKFSVIKGSGTTESEIFTILSSGNVGINQPTPTEKLHVNGNIKANTFIGDLQGNASTSSKWQFARNITLSGDISGTASLDGSSDITISTTLNSAILSDYTKRNTNETISGTWTFTNPINADITGNASTSDKWKTARTLSLSGDISGVASIDGSQNVTITTTANSEFVKRSSNETISGTWTFSSGISTPTISYSNILLNANDGGITLNIDSGNLGTKKFKILKGSGASETEIFTVLSSGKVGIGNTSPLEALDVNGNVKANVFIGNLQGNATTSSKWASPITITLAGDVSGSTSIDGSANVTINTTVNSALFADYTKRNVNETITGTWQFINTINGSITGNAGTASKWQTARVLSLTGDVTGSVSIDGSQDVSLSTTVSSDFTKRNTAETISSLWTFSSGIRTNNLIGNSAIVIKPQTDSSSAISIKNSSETSTILSVDTQNKRIGINKTLPEYDLDISGTLQVAGFRLPTGAVAGYVLTSDNYGNASWQPAPSGSGGGSVDLSNYPRKDQNETITGQWTFTQKILGTAEKSDKWTSPITLTLTGDVSGSTSIDGSANVSITATVSNNIPRKNTAETISSEWTFSGGLKTNKLTGNSSLIIKPNTDSASAVSLTNSAETSNILVVDTQNNRIGINKTSPQYALDVSGTVQVTGFRMPTGASAGYVLTSDSSGNASWQPAPSGGGSENIYPIILGSFPVYPPGISQHVVPYAVAGVAATSLSLTSGRIYWIPFVVTKNVQITQVAIYIINQSAGTSIIGLYDSNSLHQPNTLIANLVSFDTSSTGLKTSNVSVTLSPGIYWFAWVAGSGANVRALAVGSVASLGLANLGTAHTTHFYTSGTSLPNPAPTTGWTAGTGNVPAIGVIFNYV